MHVLPRQRFSCDLCDVNEKAQKANNYTHNTKIPMSN